LSIPGDCRGAMGATAGGLQYSDRNEDLDKLDWLTASWTAHSVNTSNARWEAALVYDQSKRHDISYRQWFNCVLQGSPQGRPADEIEAESQAKACLFCLYQKSVYSVAKNALLFPQVGRSRSRLDTTADDIPSDLTSNDAHVVPASHALSPCRKLAKTLPSWSAPDSFTAGPELDPAPASCSCINKRECKSEGDATLGFHTNHGLDTYRQNSLAQTTQLCRWKRLRAPTFVLPPLVPSTRVAPVLHKLSAEAAAALMRECLQGVYESSVRKLLGAQAASAVRSMCLRPSNVEPAKALPREDSRDAFSDFSSDSGR